jgi:hypothetical protein
MLLEEDASILSSSADGGRLESGLASTAKKKGRVQPVPLPQSPATGASTRGCCPEPLRSTPSPCTAGHDSACVRYGCIVSAGRGEVARREVRIANRCLHAVRNGRARRNEERGR